MNIKKLFLLFSLIVINNTTVFAQDVAIETTTDSIAHNEANDLKAVELAEFLSAAIDSSDSDMFISKLSDTKFFERILNESGNVNPDDTFVKGFIIGLRRSLNSFPEEIITEVENGSYYDFISYRYDEDQKTYYLLFRLYSDETGINYHDYRVAKVGDEFQFSDMYIYLSGENFTTTLGRMMSYSLPDKAKLEKDSKEDRDQFQKLYKATLYNNAGNYEKSYQLLDNLAPPLGKEKFLLIFKSLVASNFNDNLYLKSIEELITTYPNDPTIYLNKIDYHIYTGQYFEAIQAINRLQNETQDDFLNFLKAGVALEDENYDLALNFYKYIIDNYEDFFDAQAGYLTTLALTNNYSEATNYLNTLVDSGYDKPWLIEFVEMDDEYGENMLKGYMDSKDFKAWKTTKE